MNLSTYAACAMASLIGLAAAPAAAQTAKAAISIGAGAHPLGSAVPVVQFEYLLGDAFSLGARFARLDYTYEDGNYRETGDGRGGELMLTYHFRRQGHKGPYVSAGLGSFSSNWDWREGSARGSGRTKGAQLSGSVGWKWALGGGLYVDPSINVGHFFGSGKDTSGTRESELGSYVAVVLRAGLAF